MGRKTFESIGKVLPNRLNIIISRNQGLKIDGAVVVSSIENAIDEAKKTQTPMKFLLLGGTDF